MLLDSGLLTTAQYPNTAYLEEFRAMWKLKRAATLPLTSVGLGLAELVPHLGVEPGGS